MDRPAATPEPPYYAVIFTAVQTADLEGYAESVALMQAHARGQTGYLGMEAAEADRFEVTVSYWRDLDAILAWKRHLDHIGAQRMGRERWYASYRVRIARVERDYGFDALPG
jgi:heme-degrading monooxygenase HmoA